MDGEKLYFEILIKVPSGKRSDDFKAFILNAEFCDGEPILTKHVNVTGNATDGFDYYTFKSEEWSNVILVITGIYSLDAVIIDGGISMGNFK